MYVSLRIAYFTLESRTLCAIHMLLTVMNRCTSWMYISSYVWGVGMGYHPNRPFVADNKSLFSSSSLFPLIAVKNVGFPMLAVVKT